MLTGSTRVKSPVGRVSAAPPGFLHYDRHKKANRQVGSEQADELFRVVRVIIFAAVAFGTVAIEVETVVGQTNAMTGGNFTLT